MQTNRNTQPLTLEERIDALEGVLLCSATALHAKPEPAVLAIFLLRKAATEHRAEVAGIFGLEVSQTNVVRLDQFRRVSRG